MSEECNAENGVLHDYRHLNSPERKEIEAAILARLEAKSDHHYQWPRWAAAEEAAHAVMGWLETRPIPPGES